MAGRGPAPKARRARSTDDKRRQAEQTTLIADGELRGPELPGEAQDWPARTVAWWATWRASAQAATFTPTDWDFLLDTALLHAAVWGAGDFKQMPELRLRVAKFGATPEDRARLRLEVEAPVEAKPAATPSARKSAAARRSRLLSVVDGSAS